MTKRAVMAIESEINEEDFGLFAEGVMGYGIKLNVIKKVDYDEGEFTSWLESDLNTEGFDGGYVVTFRGGSVRYFCWYYGDTPLAEVHPKQITIFE